MLPTRVRSRASEPSFFSIPIRPDGTPASLEEIERAYVVRVLEHFEGRRTLAAHALGISYPTFLRRLRELGFDVKE
jgi:DNA-binding NtrC family response regulator